MKNKYKLQKIAFVIFFMSLFGSLFYMQVKAGQRLHYSGEITDWKTSDPIQGVYCLLHVSRNGAPIVLKDTCYSDSNGVYYLEFWIWGSGPAFYAVFISHYKVDYYSYILWEIPMETSNRDVVMMKIVDNPFEP